MRFFTADSHFSLEDVSVISRDFRPFESLDEMNEKIIEIWNSQANKGDVIYHLGDFVNYNYRDCKGYEQCFKFVQKIKADVILILGNNELRIMENLFDNDFDKFKKYLLGLGFKDVIKDNITLKIGEYEFVLNHFPVNADKSKRNLFAHVHKSVFVKKYGFNVGVDNHYFRLFNDEDIIYLEKNRVFFDSNVYD